MNEVKVKLLTDSAKIPEFKSDGASCADMCAAKGCKVPAGEIAKIPLGIAVEVPEGYELQIRSRSGHGTRGLLPALGVGTVDSDYRGEVCYLVYNSTNTVKYIDKGERVAQCKLERVEPVIYTVVDELSNTTRGEGGFGHTGRD